MNMIDYLKWRGDLTFEKDSFNLVDNLLFAYISYTDLNSIVDNSGKEVTIRQAAEKYFENHTMEEIEKSKSLIARAPEVLKYMGETERFKNCKLKYYTNQIDETTTQQFSAVHIKMDKKTTYISFCGTDDTLVGWHEDFQMSYKEISAQRQAIKYLNETAGNIGKFYVGGHSKGGNLAYYSALNCHKKIQDNIIMIYDNDGPGISDELFDKQQYDNTIDRYVKIIPEFSVFGLIYERPCQKIIVKSDQILVLQHIAHSWLVQGNDFIRTEKVTDESIMIQIALNRFLEDVNLQQREKFVNDFFSTLHKANIEMLYDFGSIGLTGLGRIIKDLMDLDEKSKEIGARLLKIISDVVRQEKDKIINTTSDYLKEKKEDISTFLKEASDYVSDYLKTRGADLSEFMKKTFDEVTSENSKKKNKTVKTREE
ncbi:MAG: Mbeg1-like protein [Erysipelotrichaceae bacterium]